VVIHEPVLEISCGQKQCAQTDTRRWSQDLAAYGAQVIRRALNPPTHIMWPSDLW